MATPPVLVGTQVHSLHLSSVSDWHNCVHNIAEADVHSQMELDCQHCSIIAIVDVILGRVVTFGVPVAVFGRAVHLFRVGHIGE